MGTPAALPMAMTPIKWRSSQQRRCSRVSIPGLILHLVAIVAYTALFLLYQPKTPPCSGVTLQPHEIPSAASVSKWETRVFDPVSFGYNRKSRKYVGAPTPEKDAAWHRLWEVGMYSMTTEEYDLWGGSTVQHREDVDQHIVIIEMFHQLHCVNMLRDMLYDRTNPYNETQWWRTGHIDHCIDYLREVVMCHGDLTPMPMVYNPAGHPTYAPHFSFVRSCRNFEDIWEFAAKGNKSGYQLDHEKGDLVRTPME